MKHILIILSIFMAAQYSLLAQQKTETKFTQITTIESVVGAGLGRSRMIITKEDGSQEEKEMSHLFSVSGISFKNIKENDLTIIQTLKSYTDNGWKLVSTSPLTLSPNQSGNGIFMTRYLLMKEEEKK